MISLSCTCVYYFVHTLVLIKEYVSKSKTNTSAFCSSFFSFVQARFSDKLGFVLYYKGTMATKSDMETGVL